MRDLNILIGDAAPVRTRLRWTKSCYASDQIRSVYNTRLPDILTLLWSFDDSMRYFCSLTRVREFIVIIIYFDSYYYVHSKLDWRYRWIFASTYSTIHQFVQFQDQIFKTVLERGSPSLQDFSKPIPEFSLIFGFALSIRDSAKTSTHHIIPSRSRFATVCAL